MRLRVLALAGALLVAPLLLAGQAHASNPQIAGLQVALRAYGLYLHPVDGIAGPETAAATRAFQRRVGLTPDGIAGRARAPRSGRSGTRSSAGATSFAATSAGTCRSCSSCSACPRSTAISAPRPNGRCGAGSVTQSSFPTGSPVRRR